MLSHCESACFHVQLGYCGPTDACLVLVYEAEPEVRKEYLIESLGWRILSLFWDTPKQNSPHIPSCTQKGKLLKWVWENCDGDQRLV